MKATEIADAMKVGALAPWFGAKRNLASRIVEALGPHRVYWEPFCGSLAVLLSKPCCVMESACDLHGDLVNLAHVIQHKELGPQLYRRLRRMWMVEELFLESAAVIRLGDFDRDSIDLERAIHFFVVSWLGRSGVVGTGSYNSHFCVRYTANGGHAAKRWRSAVDSIPAFGRRLRNVTILRRDAFDIIARIDDKAGTAIYIDPPYLVKGAKYLYDFGMNSKQGQGKQAALEDHARLAKLLARFEHARVVVSYYDDPRLADLYPENRWSAERIEVSKALAHQGRRGKNDTRATEVLIVNESPRNPGGLF